MSPFQITILIKLRTRAVKYATKKGYREFCEDFASYCLIHRLTHKGLKLEFLWVDYLRETFGDIRSVYGKMKSNVNRYALQISHRLEMPKHHAEYHQIAEDLGLKGRDKSIFLLYFEWEMNLKEVGQVLDITECRVSQLLSAIIKQLKEGPLKSWMA